MNNHRLTDQELFDLQVLHRELIEKPQADRVKAIVLLGSGWTPSHAAHVLLVDRTTVRRYYRDFKKGGVTRLPKSHYIRHRGRLSLEQGHACEDFFENTDEHLPSLRSLLTENFQIIDGKMGYS